MNAQEVLRILCLVLPLAECSLNATETPPTSAAITVPTAPNATTVPTDVPTVPTFPSVPSVSTSAATLTAAPTSTVTERRTTSGTVKFDINCSGSFGCGNRPAKLGIHLETKPAEIPEPETPETPSAPPPTSPIPLAPELQSSMQQVALQKHDKFRDVHNSPPLSLAPDLNGEAQDYATYLAVLGKLEHESETTLLTKDQGENLAYMCTARNVSAEEVARSLIGTWYNESCLYDFQKPGFRETTGHFSQIIWADSTEIGFGMTTTQKRGKKCYYLCARYRPLGNIVDIGNKEFRANVKKGRFNKSGYCPQSPALVDFIMPQVARRPKIIVV